jgi:predicted RNase H-like HicB family nuclease
MEQMGERVAIPFTFLFKRESELWTSLACEVDVASCGNTQEDARDALKEALELYVVDLLERGQPDLIPRPIPEEALQEFCNDPPPDKPILVENHTMLVQFEPLQIVFVPALLPQMNCKTAVVSP